MHKAVCRICLRSDFTRTGDIHDILRDFHDELCEYDQKYQTPMFQFCPICEHLLRKFYKFRQKCKNAHSILKSAASRKLHLDDLHKLTTPTIGYTTASSLQKVFTIKCPSLISYEAKYAKSNTSDHNVDFEYNSDDISPKKKPGIIIPELNSDISAENTDSKSKKYDLLIHLSDINASASQIQNMQKLISENALLKIKDMKNERKRRYDKAQVKMVPMLNSNETNQPITSSPKTKIQKVSHIKPNCNIFTNQNSKSKSRFKIILKSDKQKDLAENFNHQPDVLDYILQENDIEIKNNIDIAEDIEYFESDLDDNENELIACYNNKDANKTNEIKTNKKNLIKIKHVPNMFKIKPDGKQIKTVQTMVKNVHNNNLTEIKPETDMEIKSDENNAILYEDINLPELLKIENAVEMRKLLSNFTKTKQEYAHNLYSQKAMILEYLKNGELRDLGDGVSMNEELYMKLLNNNISHVGIDDIKPESNKLELLKQHLLNLYKSNNPVYQTVFTIERLDTKEKKIAEFRGRKKERWFEGACVKCESCLTVFDKKADLAVHEKTLHDPMNTEICPICSVRTNKHTLLEHMRTLHSFLYRCKECPFLSTSNNDMILHFNEHSGSAQSKPAVCPLCGATVRSERALKLHLKNKHKGKSVPRSLLSCDSCGVSLASRDLLRQHIARGHDYKTWLSAPCCSYMFNSVEEKFAHLFVCRARRRRGKSYVRVGDMEYRTCPVCQETIKNESKMSLYHHHMAAHPEVTFQPQYSKRMELCNHCGKMYPSEVLGMHLNTHTREQTWVCECGARFVTRNQLHKHRDIHKPPRVCQQCGKSFNTTSLLSRHLRFVHAKGPLDRNHKCYLCNNTFVTGHRLKSHIKRAHFKSQSKRAKKNAKPAETKKERDTMITITID